MSWAEVKKINSDLSTPLNIAALINHIDLIGDSYTGISMALVKSDELYNHEIALDVVTNTALLADNIDTYGVVLICTLADTPYTSFISFADMLEDETAMTAVAASETAMTAVIESSIAMTAMFESETAMTAVAASETAMTAVIASETAMAAVAASSVAMGKVAASSVAMGKVVESGVALNIIVKSTPAKTALIENQILFNTFRSTMLATLTAATTLFTKTAANGTVSGGTTIVGTSNSFVDVKTLLSYNNYNYWVSAKHNHNATEIIHETFTESGATFTPNVFAIGGFIGTTSSANHASYNTDKYEAI